MTRLARYPALMLIEDQIDAIGQKHRVQMIVRGTLLWAALLAASSFAAALAAHWLSKLPGGAGRWIAVDLIAYLCLIIITFIWWIGRPLLFRPDPLCVARLIETRVAGMHNALSNALLLSSRDDIAASEFLPAIYDENLVLSRTRPLGEAVKWGDLRMQALWLACVVLPLAAICCVGSVRRMLDHGWKQVFNPGHFVPQTGWVARLEVQPGDITLVAGQPLEVTILAQGVRMSPPPPAKLIFEGNLPAAELIGSPVPDSDGQTTGSLKYVYRLDHADQTMRYRAEAGGTQSPWFTVTVVREVKLQQLTLEISPPAYTGVATSRLFLKPDQIDKTPLSVPQGSRVEMGVDIDVPVSKGMLAVNDLPPAPMAAGGGQRFVGSALVNGDLEMSALLMEGAGQVIATVPEQKLAVRCIVDQPPTIEMKWPTQDQTFLALDGEVRIQAHLKDDYGVASYEVLWSASSDGPLKSAALHKFEPAAKEEELAFVLDVPKELRKHGQSLRVQVVATDNRDLSVLRNGSATSQDLGPQSVSSPIYRIEFRDPAQMAADLKAQTDRLRAALEEMLKSQQALQDQSARYSSVGKDAKGMARIQKGQSDLRLKMDQTARTFEFDDRTRIIQKTLQLLWAGEAKEAVDFAAAIQTEAVEKEAGRELGELCTRQRRISGALESLLALLNAAAEPATQPSAKESGHIPSRKEELEKLNEALKQFMKEEQRILDQTASLAKKPVDNYNDQDKKLLEDLKMAQEKLDAFMEQKLSDFSKNAEQDLSNPALLKDLMSIYAEVTMAKDALNKQSTEVAVADEEMGLESAKELSSNIEKWLPNTPNRTEWTQEDPVAKTDTPMPELPKELEDMIGELMEQQEDLSQEMEDANANWTDSMDKGVGWDAMDGPIADMSAKGVTGNTLPNDNEMGGRSGEGRSGKSQGEMVGDTAVGKGGRNTPTRLDPTPFEKGQVKDESKDPVGGATGGGKLSGQGGEGLEGPVGPKMKEQMQRLAQKEAQLRNTAEQLQLKYRLDRYDNFKLQDSIALMRRMESDLQSNRYQSAMRVRDVVLDRMDTSKLLVEGRISVDHDASATPSTRLRGDINDAQKGEMPAAWSDALKEYYKRLSQE